MALGRRRDRGITTADRQADENEMLNVTDPPSIGGIPIAATTATRRNPGSVVIQSSSYTRDHCSIWFPVRRPATDKMHNGSSTTVPEQSKLKDRRGLQGSQLGPKRWRRFRYGPVPAVYRTCSRRLFASSIAHSTLPPVGQSQKKKNRCHFASVATGGLGRGAGRACSRG